MAGSSNKIFSGVSWSIITNVVNALYGFIMIPILIKYFGKAEYGLIGLAQSVNAYMRLMDMGLTSTNVRFFSNWLTKGDNDKVKKLFSTCTSIYGVVGLINAAVLIVVYFFSDSIFNVTPEQDEILKTLLLILAFSAFVNWFTSCYNQIIQATENVAWTQKRILVTKLLMVLVLILTVTLKLNLITYFILTIAASWSVLPWVIRKIKKLTPFVSFLPSFDKSVFKEILPYTLNIFSFSIFSFSFTHLRPVLLGIQGNVESVVDLKIIMGVVNICSAFSAVFISTLLPSSSKVIAQGDKEKFNMIAYSGTKYIMIFIAFCVFGLLTISKDFLLVYVGEEFLYLVPWLSLFLLVLLNNHVSGISSLILAGTNIRPLSRMTAVSATVALVVAWFLIPKFQVGGVGIATAVYSVMQILFYYLYYWPVIMKIDSWRIFRTIFVPVVIIGCIACAITVFIPGFTNSWLHIFQSGIIFSVLFGAMIWFYLRKEDKTFILGLVKAKRK